MNTMKSSFHILGSRTYVQGSTLFDGAMDACKNWGISPVDYVEMNCRSIICEQGVYELLGTDQDEKKYDTLFKVISGDHTHKIGLLRNGDAKLESVPYDEDALVRSGIISPEKKTISFDWKTELPLMKVLIALFKRLLLETQVNEGFGKWIYYKSDLNLVPFRNNASLRIELKSMIGGVNAKGHIYLNDKEVGKIYFNRPRV